MLNTYDAAQLLFFLPPSSFAPNTNPNKLQKKKMTFCVCHAVF